MDNRKLMQLAAELQGKSAAEVDTILRRQHLDVSERVAVKLQMAAAGPHTLRAAGFATYTADYRRPVGEMPRTLRRMGVDPQRTYTEAELTDLIRQAGLEPEQAIAVRIYQARAVGHTQFWLEPVTPAGVEDEDDPDPWEHLG
jgi:hypothetical protein